LSGSWSLEVGYNFVLVKISKQPLKMITSIKGEYSMYCNIAFFDIPVVKKSGFLRRIIAILYKKKTSS
jgi:hypothetical protein